MINSKHLRTQITIIIILKAMLAIPLKIQHMIQYYMHI